MLQPHHLVDALATLGDDGRTKLSEGPFSEVLRSAQVRTETSALFFFLDFWRLIVTSETMFVSLIRS